MFDYSRLIGKIIEVYKTRGEFAKAIGVSKNCVSRILNGKAYIKNDDIALWADALGIGSDEIGVYFFTRKVHESEQ